MANAGSGDITNEELNGTISITIDGRSPITTTTGNFFLLYGQQDGGGNAGKQTFITPNLAISYFDSASYGGYRKIHIPYYVSISITYTPVSVPVIVYSQVIGFRGPVPSGMYPPNQQFNMYSAPLTTGVAAFSALNILPQVAGPGTLKSIFLYMAGVPTVTGQPSWLEGNPNWVVDGQPTLYGGTEDAFGRQNYGFGLQNSAGATSNVGNSTEWGFARNGIGTGTKYYTAMYRYFDEYPVNFNTSMALYDTNGQSGEGATPPPLEWAANVVYYTYPSTFTPSTATLISRWDASSLAGLGSGATVTAWPDQGAQANTLKPLFGSPKFVPVSNVNSLPAVRLNGTTDCLNTSTLLFPGSSAARTVFMVVTPPQTPSQNGKTQAYISSYGGSTVVFLADQSSNDYGIFNYAGNAGLATQPVLGAQPQLVMFVLDGTSSRISVNGVSSTLAPSLGSPSWTNGLTLGAVGDGSAAAAGDYAYIAVYQGDMSTSDAAQVAAQIALAKGITVGSAWD